MKDKPLSILSSFFRFLVGKPRDPHDKKLLHNISLISFFAWIGLGADGLSSSSYGPQEAFGILGTHMYLGVYIAIATALTVFVISTSYSQIIELFPNGGGGYLVASRLLSPFVGMVSGCALMIDYVLTIAVSVASGADAVFSFLPVNMLSHKLLFAVVVLIILIILNLRGVKESITVLMPIFLIFIFVHIFLILYSFGFHLSNSGEVMAKTVSETKNTVSTLGIFGTIFLLMKAYSMGAGTYTGIEAVSNGTSILREPRVKTAKRTMLYMSTSLAFMVFGIILAYVFYNVQMAPGKTLNAVLFTSITASFDPTLAAGIVFIALFSEAMLLFAAAQTGFIGGPRILANMAIDRWMPKRFALLSDRLVTINGILIMGVASLVLMIMSRGNVTFLVVLYSINVFLTFSLSQLGMVKHWWRKRKYRDPWFSKMFVNGIGLVLTVFILLFVLVIKFNEGGWLTILITASLVAISMAIKNSYTAAERISQNLDSRVLGVAPPSDDFIPALVSKQEYDPTLNTAVVIVKDFNGVGVYTISQILHSFKGVFRSFVFVQVGLINAETISELSGVDAKLSCEIQGYISLMKQNGYYAEAMCVTALDTVDGLTDAAKQVSARFKNPVFFGGQIVLPNEGVLSKMLHHYTLFAMQKRLYQDGIPLYIVPIRV